MGLIYSTAALAAGIVVGVSVGAYLFSAFAAPANLDFLHEDADRDSKKLKRGQAVSPAMRKLLPHVDTWTFWPDYERVTMMNRMMKLMWPMLSKAIITESLTQAKAALKANVFDKFSFVEDIILGDVSLKGCSLEDDLHLMHGWECTLGSRSPRLGGIKVYSDTEDEAVMELPLLWGSNCKFDVGVFLRWGLFRLWVPLQLSQLVVRVDARVTAAPLLDELPCLGGVTLSILRNPTLDCTLKLGGVLDVMALPSVRTAVQGYLRSMLEGMLVYPNSMSFPIMDDYGIRPPPTGSLSVRLISARVYSGDEVYVELCVRPDRPLRSKTLKGTKHPEYNEDFCFLVDDFCAQQLMVKVYDDTVGWNDKVLGWGFVLLGEEGELTGEVDSAGKAMREPPVLADFIRAPHQKRQFEVQLQKPTESKKSMAGAAAHTAGMAGIRATIAAHKAAKHTASMARSTGMAAAGALTQPGGARRRNSVDVCVSTPPNSPPPGSCPTSPDRACGASEKSKYGRVLVEVCYTPFKTDQEGDEKDAAKSASAPGGALGAKGTTVPLPPPALSPSTRMRNVMTSVDKNTRGVLTVNLVRCINLAAHNDGKDLQTYVRFVVSTPEDDPDPDIQQTSRPIFHELSPRWGDKFDFVRCKAGATLNVCVLNKEGVLGSVLKGVGKLIGGGSSKDKTLGRVSIPVRDVVRNGRLRNTFHLHDVSHGAVELVLTWMTIDDQLPDADPASMAAPHAAATGGTGGTGRPMV